MHSYTFKAKQSKIDLDRILNEAPKETDALVVKCPPTLEHWGGIKTHGLVMRVRRSLFVDAQTFGIEWPAKYQVRGVGSAHFSYHDWYEWLPANGTDKWTAEALDEFTSWVHAIRAARAKVHTVEVQYI